MDQSGKCVTGLFEAHEQLATGVGLPGRTDRIDQEDGLRPKTKYGIIASNDGITVNLLCSRIGNGHAYDFNVQQFQNFN